MLSVPLPRTLVVALVGACLSLAGCDDSRRAADELAQACAECDQQNSLAGAMCYARIAEARFVKGERAVAEVKLQVAREKMATAIEEPTHAPGDLITVDMGTPKVLGDTTVGVDTVTWAARHIDMGNPHAVAFVSSLAEIGPLLEPPRHDPAVYPDGVNVEFVVRRGERHVSMRVHERGSGETRSCGTGACAAMVAAAVAAGDRPAANEGQSDVAYRVDVPGGTLTVTWTADDRVLLTGPAVIVARGTTDL